MSQDKTEEMNSVSIRNFRKEMKTQEKSEQIEAKNKNMIKQVQNFDRMNYLEKVNKWKSIIVTGTRMSAQ